MLKVICEGIDKNREEISEVDGGGSSRDGQALNLFKSLLNADMGSSEFDAYLAQFESVLQNKGRYTLDDLNSSLESMDFGANGEYLGGGEAAAKMIGTPVASLAKMMSTVEDAEEAVEKLISETSKEKKGKKVDLTEDDVVEKINAELALGPKTQSQEADFGPGTVVMVNELMVGKIKAMKDDNNVEVVYKNGKVETVSIDNVKNITVK